jgi:sulfofructose kinase
MSSYDVVGLGIVTTDHLGILDQFPEEDTKQRLHEYTQQGGGTVGTPLVVCARLGLRSAYIGRLGDDPSSEFVRRDFEREGVDTAHVINDRSFISPSAMILVNPSTHTRTIAWHKPATSEIRVSDMNADVVRSSRAFYVDAHEGPASLAAARVALESGAMVFVDADNLTDGIRSVLPLADVIIGSAHFARLRYGDGFTPEQVARLLFDEFGGICAITAGVDGSYVVTEEGRFHQPAFEIDVVDTTGAGDVYHGGFLFGLLRGWPVSDCACFASATAALKCRALGGRAGVPRFEEVTAFLDLQEQSGAWNAE